MYAKELRISWRSTPVTDPKRAIRALPRQMIVLQGLAFIRVLLDEKVPSIRGKRNS